VKICWATDYPEIGNAYGFSVHNRMTRKALIDAGLQIDGDGKIAFHVGPAHIFRPLKGKFNILYWAWEHYEVPEFQAEGLRKADYIITTARFLVDVVKKYAPPRIGVECCYEGVDVGTFSFFQRPLKPERFRFLWVGAPNARKGWEDVLAAWEYFKNRRDVELYLKTTVQGEYKRIGNVIWDARKVAPEELAAIYISANCFVFPSRGEGFGLTLAEAMATGLPCIYTPVTSLSEIADPSSAYPVKYRMEDSPQYPASGVRWAIPEPESIVERMLEVMYRYPEALRKGKKASRKIRERFTWERCAKRLLSILGAFAPVLSAN